MPRMTAIAARLLCPITRCKHGWRASPQKRQSGGRGQTVQPAAGKPHAAPGRAVAADTPATMSRMARYASTATRALATPTDPVIQRL